MTHGPPQSILDLCADGNVGCSKLYNAVRKVRPLMHCFGHIHEGNGAIVKDWKAETTLTPQPALEDDFTSNIRHVRPDIMRDQQTLMINAAIMDQDNRPANAPWLVDIRLPCV